MEAAHIPQEPPCDANVVFSTPSSPCWRRCPSWPPIPYPSARRTASKWNARLRHEAVDDDAFVHCADATTLRLRAGVRASFGGGFGVLVEAEGVAAAASYNSGANGRVAYLAVIDPQGVELKQAWIGWNGRRAGEHACATLGRQRLLFDTSAGSATAAGGKTSRPSMRARFSGGHGRR